MTDGSALFAHLRICRYCAIFSSFTDDMGAAMNSQRGLFVVVEGPDGAGKSTLARSIENRLRADGHDVLLAREPGSTPLGEEVRRVLLESEYVNPYTELMLLNAARSALVRDVVVPALAAGRVVILDRYDLSSFAYQGYGHGIPLDQVRAVCDAATGGLRPDVTFVLDAPAEVLAERMRGAGRSPDRIERLSSDFHRRVLEGYRDMLSRDSTLIRLDATRSQDDVLFEALGVIRPALKLKTLLTRSGYPHRLERRHAT